MMTLFDYIYYRWFKIYAKKDVDPNMSASVIVSLYQLFTLVNLVSFGCIIFEVERPNVKYLIPVILLFFAINYFRYERGFDMSKLDDRWGNEPKKKKQRNLVFLIAYLAITFITPWVYGFATK